MEMALSVAKHSALAEKSDWGRIWQFLVQSLSFALAQDSALDICFRSQRPRLRGCSAQTSEGGCSVALHTNSVRILGTSWTESFNLASLRAGQPWPGS